MADAHDLAPDERRELLRIARATLREFADSGRIPPGKPHRASLVVPATVAVALVLDGRPLARAVGLTPRPLYRAIQEELVAAARTVTAERSLDDDLVDQLLIEVEVATAGDPAVLREPSRAT
ncbi:MAG: hypothetical protein IPL61_11330 [Myxococcales bacterium]|nr:hypothetical protein [Myxococcales bacterium]